jgi:hypothetical protein
LPVLLGLAAKLGKAVVGRVLKKRTVAAIGTGITVGTIPLPGGSLISRAGQGVRAAVKGRRGRRPQKGEPGYKARRMNAGNASAARRAIRRIKSVRNLLKSIEKQLPKRAATRSKGAACR